MIDRLYKREREPVLGYRDPVQGAGEELVEQQAGVEGEKATTKG